METFVNFRVSPRIWKYLEEIGKFQCLVFQIFLTLSINKLTSRLMSHWYLIPRTHQRGGCDVIQFKSVFGGQIVFPEGLSGRLSSSAVRPDTETKR